MTLLSFSASTSLTLCSHIISGSTSSSITVPILSPSSLGGVRWFDLFKSLDATPMNISPVAAEKDLFSGFEETCWFPADPSEEEEHDSLREKTLGERLKLWLVRSDMKGLGRREIAMDKKGHTQIIISQFPKLEIWSSQFTRDRESWEWMRLCYVAKLAAL